jgi:type IV secretion system protein TrbE
MIKVSRILKDYRDAGAVHSLVSLWGFVDAHTFLTKGGALGQVFRLRGADAECLDHVERRAITHRLENALRQLDESVRVYEYLIKRPAAEIAAPAHPDPLVQDVLQRRAAYLTAKADALFEVELYLVLLYEGWRPRRGSSGRSPGFLAAIGAALRRWFSRQSVMTSLADQITKAAADLHQHAQAFTFQLADTVAPTLLTKAEAFTFFRRLLNYAPHKVDGVHLKYDTHLDFYAADSAIDCHRDHLQLDAYRVKVLTMKDPPARTFAAILQDLSAIPSPFIACVEWQQRSNAAMRREIRRWMRHHFNRKFALINYVSPQTTPDEMLVDESAAATVRELGQTLTALEVEGHVFGACSLTLVAYDRDAARLARTVADCSKVFAGHDGALYEESYNLLNAWLAIVPGNAAYNLRRLALLNTHAADLSLLFTLDTGQRTSAHLGGRPSLAVFETDDHTPYFWNLHHQDVGHTFIQGATGSGKSFLCNFIVAHAQQYDPTTVIFDLGGSYERLTRHLGGSVWKVGLTHRDFTINPFCLPETDENLHFLFSLLRVLIESSDQYKLTEADDRELYDAVKHVYSILPPQRRLITLATMLPHALAQHLHRWVQGGPYASLFDNADDTLTFQRVQCFDFEGLDNFPLILEPLLFYVLHRANTAIQDRTADATLKLFFLDEAWRFARHPKVKAYITDALKTWRKRNAAMILATQSSEDFPDRDLLRTVIESCPTKFFLANPNLDVSRARELFHLNHTEALRITQLQAHRQALLKRPDISKVLNLTVDPTAYAIYDNTAPHPERLAAVR